MTASDPPVRTALEIVRLARAGHFDEIFERLAPPLQPLVTGEALRAAWDAGVSQRGRVTSAGEPVSESTRAGVVVVNVPTFGKSAHI